VFEEGLTIMANLGTEGFKKGTKEIESAVKKLAASAKRFGTQMTSSIKRLIPMIIGVGSAYGIISKGVSAFMAENEMLSARMSAIWTAVGNLLGPIITQIIDWVSTAVSYFLGFLKLLGVTNKSASELSKKAKKNAADLQRTIAGFDELNVLQEPPKENPLQDLENKDWMKDLAELLKNKMWDDAANLIVGKINRLIDTFKSKSKQLGQVIGEYLGGAMHIVAKVIREVDWQGLGEGIANFFNGLIEGIDGKDLGAILVRKVVILFGILTGFLANLDWEKTADLVIDAFIGVFDTLADAIEKADFQKIGEGIRKFLEKVWERKDELAEVIFKYLKAIWEAALDLLNGVLGGDENNEHPIIVSLRNLGEAIEKLAATVGPIIEDLWHNILEPVITWLIDEGLPITIDRISSFIGDITDFLSGDIGLAEFIGRVVGELLGFFADITGSFDKLLKDLTGLNFMEWAEKIWEDIKGAWENIKNWWHEVAFEDGKFCIGGLLDGIVEKIIGIGEWIKTNVFDKFIKGFRDAFDMHSPSKEMLKLGKDILQGLIDGVTELLPNLDTIKNGITEAWGKLKETVSGWWDSVKGWFTGADKTSDSADGMETSLNNANTAAGESAEAVSIAASKYAEAYGIIRQSAEEAMKVVEECLTKIMEESQKTFDFLNENTDKETRYIEEALSRTFEQIASSARVWGSDLVECFIIGIERMLPALVAELQGMANLINSYIGFSKPDKGPLSDFDKSGPDMIDLFASGLEDSKGRLVTALNDIADTVSVRAPGMAGGAVLPYGVAAASGSADAASADATNERLLEAINSLENSLLNNQWVIDFGNFRLVAKELTRVQRQMARAEGA